MQPTDIISAAPATIAANLAHIGASIEAALEAAGRPSGSVKLVAVSKRQPVERVTAALEAGQRRFGENYVQDAHALWPELRDRFEGIELHMIGPLQTNKADLAVETFDVIQTLDRPRLAAALAKAIKKTGKTPRLLVQVNTGEEPQKAGVLPKDVDGFLTLCREEHDLSIEGLMAIPPVDEEIALHAALLRKIAGRHGLAEVSIGMSADFETAVRFGATMVRVGSSIFGERSRRG